MKYREMQDDDQCRAMRASKWLGSGSTDGSIGKEERKLSRYNSISRLLCTPHSLYSDIALSSRLSSSTEMCSSSDL